MDKPESELIERLIKINDRYGYYSYNTVEQIALEVLLVNAIDKGRKSVLDDLHMFMKLNEDDLDRGKGVQLINKFIKSKRDES